MKKLLGFLILILLICNNAHAVNVKKVQKKLQRLIATGKIYKGMNKGDFCYVAPVGSLIGWTDCVDQYNQEPYFKNGVEVVYSEKRKYYVIFKDVKTPTSSGMWYDGGFHAHGTFVDIVWSRSEALKIAKSVSMSAQNNTGNNMDAATMIERAKDTCKSLGFNEGTEKFSDCSLKLYSQSLELAANQNQKVVVQNQGNSSNKMIIYDPVRDSENLQRRALGLINGTCTLANYINC